MIRDITIGQYYPAKSILHRLDPRVKVVSTLLFLISLFLFRSIPGYIIATAFLVMVVRLSKVPFGYIVKGLKPIIMILMLTVLFQLFLTRGGATLVHWWIFTITEEGLVNAVYMAIRKLIYLGKELSLLLFSIFIDILLVLTSIIFYYAVLIHNPKVASGILYDSNAGMEIAQIICNCMFWLITIYLVMLIATKLKTLVCVGTYMILYIIMNLMSYMDGIKYLSPLHYIVAVSSNTLQFTFSTMIFSLYTICMGILFTHIGIRRIEKMDL